MNNAPQYSLRWNNYVSHVTEAFNALRFDNDLVDVTLCCDGGKIKAHKMLLSACSNYFKQIFKENPCQHPVIIFKNFKYEDLNAIINFMYHGEVNIFQEQLESFLNTAELLEVKGLTDNMEEEATQKLMRISDNTSLDLSAKSSRFSEDIVPVLSDEPINLATMQPVREEYIPQVSPVTFASEPENGAVEILPEVSKAEERASPMPTPATPPNEEMQVDMQSTSTEDFTEKSNSVSASQATKESCKNKPGRARNKRTFLRSKKNHRLQSNGGTKMPVKIKKVENVRQENTSVNKKPQSKAKRQLRTLKRKVLIESDLVKFRCQLCPKGFKHPTSLTLHKDSHAGKTQCPVCHRSFSRSYDMRSHLQRIHQGKQLTIKEIRYKNSDNSPKSFTHNI